MNVPIMYLKCISIVRMMEWLSLLTSVQLVVGSNPVAGKVLAECERPF